MTLGAHWEAPLGRISGRADRMTHDVVAEIWVQAAPPWWRRVVLRQAWTKPRTVMWLTRGGDWIVSSAANAEEVATATDLVMREG